MCGEAALTPFTADSNNGRFALTTSGMRILNPPAGKYLLFLEGKDGSVTVYGKTLTSPTDSASVPASRADSSTEANMTTGEFSFPGDERDILIVCPKTAGIGFILSSGASAQVLNVTYLGPCG